jgi:hypothetical protein
LPKKETLQDLWYRKDKMLKKIKEALGLTPKASPGLEPQDALKISVGVQGNKIVILLDKKVDTITLDKVQLTNFLGALASRATLIK